MMTSRCCVCVNLGELPEEGTETNVNSLGGGRAHTKKRNENKNLRVTFILNVNDSELFIGIYYTTLERHSPCVHTHFPMCVTCVMQSFGCSHPDDETVSAKECNDVFKLTWQRRS